MTEGAVAEDSRADRRIPVALVSAHDTGDVSAWSGIPFFMSQCLRRVEGLDVRTVSPLSAPSAPRRAPVLRWIDRLLHPARRIWPHYEPAAMKSTAREAMARVYPGEIVFSIFPDPWVEADSGNPWVFFSDATFASLRRLYPALNKLHPRTVRRGERFWAKAVKRADAMIFSSDWAAQSAINDYGASPTRVRVIPLGVNLDPVPSRGEVAEIVSQRDPTALSLLWIGVDWERKGGDEAVRLAAELHNRGIETTLHLVGCTPPAAVPAFVKAHGFLRKGVAEERRRLFELLRTSHFFVLPTLAECAAMVFAEANAFGLPVVTNDVGGNSTVVHDGVNGRVLPVDSFLTGAVDYIERTFRDNDVYLRAVLAAKNDQDRRLTWSSFAAQTADLLRSLPDT